ncbi:LysR family transcriptional regulator [Bacillaceae bacterium]
MDMQQLITFQKLAREKSFKRTSKELGISQPTVTTRIKALEEELGETLIIRTGHKAVLTPVGELFLSYVDRALKVLQVGIDRVRTPESTDIVAIGGTATIITYWLPNELKTFQMDYPHFEWKIYTGSSEKVLQMILDGIVDIGFVYGGVEHQQVCAYPLLEEELYVIVPAGHPLGKRESIRIEELQNEQILLYRPHSQTWSLIQERFREAGIRPWIGMNLEHVVAVKQMMLANAGVAFLPESTVREELESGQLQKVRLQDSPIVRPTSIVLPKRPPTGATACFLRFIHQTFGLNRIPEEVTKWVEEPNR